jgi:hypothetical protein
MEYGTDDYKIDVTGIVYKKCWTHITIPQDKNSLFGDPCYMIEKFIFVGDRVFNENEVVELDYMNNLAVYYGIDTHKINVTSVVLEKCVTRLVIPKNKNELFGDPVSGQLKKIWVYYSDKPMIYNESDIIHINFTETFKIPYLKFLQEKKESCRYVLEIARSKKNWDEYFQQAIIHHAIQTDLHYDTIIVDSFQDNYFCLENYPKLLTENGIMVMESTLDNKVVNFLPDHYMYKNYDNYFFIEPMKKKTTAVVFICHDTSSVNKIKKYLSDEDTYVIYVGNNKLQEHEFSPKIFIANSFTDNIENEYLLLTFTAWYLIAKNNLFIEYDYLCLFEYDVDFLVDDFVKTIQKECQNSGHYIFGFCPLNNYFKFDINWSVLENFLKQKQLDYQYKSNSLWYTTTNYCLKRNIILEFVDWYYPACLKIKNQDLSNFSYYHERLFWIFISTKNYCVGNQSHLLEHTQSKSHDFHRNLPVNDFDWQLYALLNPDLATAGLQTQEQLTKHFIEYG